MIKSIQYAIDRCLLFQMFVEVQISVFCYKQAHLEYYIIFQYILFIRYFIILRGGGKLQNFNYKFLMPPEVLDFQAF